MPMWELDEHAAPDNAVVELFQPGGALTDVGLERVETLKAAECDLSRNRCHGNLAIHCR
jgi:hypothetical protein